MYIAPRDSMHPAIGLTETRFYNPNLLEPLLTARYSAKTRKGISASDLILRPESDGGSRNASLKEYGRDIPLRRGESGL